jgi:hypothetical protein
MDDVAVSTAGTVSQDRPAGDAREAAAPRVVEVNGGRAQRSLRELALDAAAVVGLAGLAITQPVLDLFGKNPTFFVAGNYGRRQIVAFVLVVAVVPALTVWIVTALAGLAHQRTGVVVHRLGVVMLGGLFGLVLARSWGLDRMVTAFALAGVVGLGVAWAEWRWRPARTFLAYLAVGTSCSWRCSWWRARRPICCGASRTPTSGASRYLRSPAR